MTSFSPLSPDAAANAGVPDLDAAFEIADDGMHELVVAADAGRLADAGYAPAAQLSNLHLVLFTAPDRTAHSGDEPAEIADGVARSLNSAKAAVAEFGAPANLNPRVIDTLGKVLAHLERGCTEFLAGRYPELTAALESSKAEFAAARGMVAAG